VLRYIYVKFARIDTPMDFKDIGSFIARYYIDPIVYNEGYNVVNTLTYAIILAISLFAILKLMALLRLQGRRATDHGRRAFIILGASLRNLEDVHLLSPR